MSKEVAYNDSIQNNIKDIEDFKDNEDDIVNRMSLEEISRRENNEKLPDNAKEYARAMFEILWGINNNEDSAKLLDSIDSVFIYHTYPKDYSPRETLVSFMNSICCWSVIYKNNNSVYYDSQIISFKELYSEYKDYCKDSLKVSTGQKISYKDFKSHIRKHTLIKFKNARHDGVKLRCDTIIGLPQKSF